MVSVTLLKSTRVPPRAFSRQDLEQLASYVLHAQKVCAPVELAVEMTGHKRIQTLNRRFRGVDRTTDVISFRDELIILPTSHVPRSTLNVGRRTLDAGFRGDIAINVHQAALQAKKMRHPLRREVRLLLIHGILHLLGYTDYEARPRRQMFKRQNAILRNWERRPSFRRKPESTDRPRLPPG